MKLDKYYQLIVIQKLTLLISAKLVARKLQIQKELALVLKDQLASTKLSYTANESERRGDDRFPDRNLIQL